MYVILAVIADTSSACQTLILVRLYTTLLSDRATLQKEVMREYNVKFVHPTLFKQKRDASTMTEDMSTSTDMAMEEEPEYREEVVVRGSGRKVRRVVTNRFK